MASQTYRRLVFLVGLLNGLPQFERQFEVFRRAALLPENSICKLCCIFFTSSSKERDIARIEHRAFPFGGPLGVYVYTDCS